MVRITLRLTDELHAKIVQVAKEADRSMHGQVVHILRKWLKENQDEIASQKGHGQETQNHDASQRYIETLGYNASQNLVETQHDNASQS